MTCVHAVVRLQALFQNVMLILMTELAFLILKLNLYKPWSYGHGSESALCYILWPKPERVTESPLEHIQLVRLRYEVIFQILESIKIVCEDKEQKLAFKIDR